MYPFLEVTHVSTYTFRVCCQYRFPLSVGANRIQCHRREMRTCTFATFVHLRSFKTIKRDGWYANEAESSEKWWLNMWCSDAYLTESLYCTHFTFNLQNFPMDEFDAFSLSHLANLRCLHTHQALLASFGSQLRNFIWSRATECYANLSRLITMLSLADHPQ